MVGTSGMFDIVKWKLVNTFIYLSKSVASCVRVTFGSHGLKLLFWKGSQWDEKC